MRILQMYQHGEPYQVQLSATSASGGGAGRQRGAGASGGLGRWWPIAAGIGGLLVLLLIIGLVYNFLNSGGDTGTLDTAGTQTGITAAAPQDNAAADTAAAPAQSAAPAAPALPDSINAHPNIEIGKRIRIRPGLVLSLRSEASAQVGQTLGYMENGQEATIIDGPIQTAGKSDTIVWWYIRMDSGLEAWAAANTSDLTLLEPVE